VTNKVTIMRVRIIGNKQTGFEVIEYDPETGLEYTSIPCTNIRECEEIAKDLQYPERVNVKLLMLNYHLFADNPSEAKKKIKKWLRQKAFENCELDYHPSECEYWRRIYNAFKEYIHKG